MDPTAPKDNNNSQGSAKQNPPPSPIQPGQFVVTGEEDVFKQPPPPTAPPNPETFGAAGGRQAVPPPNSVHQPIVKPPEVPLAASQAPADAQPSAPGADQPNPTPYVAPPVSPTSQPQQPSVINKLRKVFIVLIILAILGAVAAAAWFFTLGKDKLTKKPEIVQETEVEASPTPLPKRTVGGFADLPAATNESQASPSASPQ